jgi:hypothetical protein
MNICNLCNYTSDHTSNYYKHCESIIHLTKELNNTFCSLCNKKYTSVNLYKKHRYNVHKSNDKEEINKSNKEVVLVNNLVNKPINKASSLIKYLMENHESTPPLKKINHKKCIDILRLDYNCPLDKKTENEYILEKTLIQDFSNNIFVKNISKSILNLVNYKDVYNQTYKEPSNQPIWNTDCSRLHYVVKISLTKWDEDKSGIIFTEYIIKPLLECIYELINKYRNNVLDKINMIKNNYNENIKHVNLLSDTLNLETELIKQNLVKPILKELAPHLRYTV